MTRNDITRMEQTIETATSILSKIRKIQSMQDSLKQYKKIIIYTSAIARCGIELDDEETGIILEILEHHIAKQNALVDLL